MLENIVKQFLAGPCYFSKIEKNNMSEYLKKIASKNIEYNNKLIISNYMCSQTSKCRPPTLSN